MVEEELYKLDYQFQPDLDLSRRECALDQRIERALSRMFPIGEGVSSVAFVSVLKSFNKQMEKLIYDLPKYFHHGDFLQPVPFLNGWWSNVFILFQVPDEASGKDTVEEILMLHPKIRRFVVNGNTEWTWIAKDTPVRMCTDRITGMCLKVKEQIGGKVFIENIVLRNLRKIIEGVERYTNEDTERSQNDSGFQRKIAKSGINFIQSDDEIMLKFGDIPVRNEISILSMRIILRNSILTKEEIERFREHYKNPNAKVSIREVLDFLTNL